MTEEHKRFTITIEVEGGTENAVIRTSDGREWHVKGISIFADGGPNELFTFFWNSPSVAATAFVRGLIEAVNQGNEVAAQFYRAVLKMLVLATGTGEHPKQILPEELLAKWSKEDEEEESKKMFH